jgi:hypothetical protein
MTIQALAGDVVALLDHLDIAEVTHREQKRPGGPQI